MTEEDNKKYIEEKNLEAQKKKVDAKINPILQSYKEGKTTKIEFIEQLSDAFYSLEKE